MLSPTLKKSSRFLLAALIPLCGITYAEAQNKAEYKIGAYEKSKRGNWVNNNYVYEIRKLFLKKDTTWVIDTFKTNAKYTRVFRGNKLETIAGRCCNESHLLYWDKGLDTFINEIILKPSPIIQLTGKYFSKQFTSDYLETIKKGCFLSNNSLFKQNTKLKKYIVTTEERKMLFDSTKAYVERLFRSNTGCNEGFNAAKNIDSIINRIINPVKEIFIDSINTFIDKDGNKIINVLFPTFFLYNNFYPFEESCFREDNGYKYYQILCFLDNGDKLNFLQDELQYLDHGDFDNDGKDEYIFWYSIFNFSGYVMYYNDFKSKVEFKWHYH